MKNINTRPRMPKIKGMSAENIMPRTALGLQISKPCLRSTAAMTLNASTRYKTKKLILAKIIFRTISDSGQQFERNGAAIKI